MDIVKFLKDNGLKKGDVADYCGIGSSNISAWVKNGDIPKKHLGRLLNNDEGWDTSALRAAPPEDDLKLLLKALNEQNALLRKIIADQKEIIENYQAAADIYKEEIAILKAFNTLLRNGKA